MLVHANTNEFNETLSKDFFVVDLFATWCGPCKMLAPVYEAVSGEYPNVPFLKIDVDQDPDVAARYKVTTVPTVLFIKGGEVVDKAIGFLPKDQLKKKVEAYL